MHNLLPCIYFVKFHYQYAFGKLAPLKSLSNSENKFNGLGISMAETLKITSKGQGPTLVFIHGWGLNSGVWQPVIEKLMQDFEVITVDLPGFGINVEHCLSVYTIENVAEQIMNAVNKPSIYIGWSLGGLITTQIALTAPHQVHALVTIASTPCFLEKQDDEITNESVKDKKESLAQTRLNLWPGIKAPLLATFHQQLSKDIQKTLDGFLKIQAMGSPHIREDIKIIRNLVMQYPVPSRKTLDDSLALLETVDLREKLTLLELPFLRLYGRLDSLVPKTIPNLVSKLAPASEQYIFHRASHAPFISHADDFVEILRQWLNKLPTNTA